MKIFLTILSFIICSYSFGISRKVYVSNNGSDAGTGTISLPYQTIGKVNSVFSTLLPGDTVFFNRGDIFYGPLIATAAGSSGASIVISAYGSGALPIFTGLILLHTWTVVSGNIWQCTPDSTILATCNVLTIAGIPQAVGRTNWMPYQSATGSGSSGTLTSTSLAGTNYTGAEIISRKNGFLSDKAIVTSQSGNTVNFSTAGYTPLYANVAGLSNGSSGYGFFMQRFAGTLDQQGEWFFNSATNKMRIYSTVNPNTLVIKASYVNAVIELSSRNNITIENINIEGASTYGVHAFNSLNLKVKNCTFRNNTIAIYFGNSSGLLVSNCDIDYSFSCAIFLGGNTNTVRRLDVLNNTVNHTGQMPGMGIFNKDFCLRGIIAFADIDASSNNWVNVIGNVVKNTGNGAIQFQGSNVIIRRNITDTFANVLDDNGGIYTFINNQSNNTTFFSNRIVDSNFIGNAIGAPLGAPAGHLDVVGFYNDDQVCNLIGSHNSIWNIPGNGIQMNNPLNITIRDNTVYNADYAVWVNEKQFGTLSGNSVKHNTLYQKSASQYIYYYTHWNTSNINQALTNFIVSDSNYISNLKTAGYGYYYNGNVFPPPLTLTQWQNTYGHSVHSLLPITVLTATNSTMYRNPAYGNVVVNFTGLSKVDAQGNIYNNTVTIPAWSSKMLIDNGSAPVNQFPTASAGGNQSIVSPASSVTLAGTGSDPDGTVSSTRWKNIDGPNSPTIVDTTALTTVVNGLVIGLYHFQLTVTDNSGAQTSSTMSVTITPPPNQAPTANAGRDTLITLPVTSVSVTATAFDPEAGAMTLLWTFISGPATPTFSNSAALMTAINGLTVAGTYQFSFKATDPGGLSSTDFMQVVVSPAVNIFPVANAGADQTTSGTAVTLNANLSTDDDGTIVSYAWTQLPGGPNTATKTVLSTTAVSFSGLVIGVYNFDLAVTDNSGAVSHDGVQVTINPPPNGAPTGSAGSDTSIMLPVNSVSVTATATDPNGDALTYIWTQLSGPATAVFSNPAALTTTISNMTVAGTYQFNFRATDPGGLFFTDGIQVNVAPPVNKPPVARAGTDTAITLPVNSAILNGNASSDSDGTVISRVWTQLSGPSTATITILMDSSITVSNLIRGAYLFDLAVTDNSGAVSHDGVQVTVNPAIPVAPTAEAGLNRLIILPKDSVHLIGSSPDVDIISIAWEKFSGPVGAVDVIEDSTAYATTITGLTVEGIYLYKLTVTDSDGLPGSDFIQVTVRSIPASEGVLIHGWRFIDH